PKFRSYRKLDLVYQILDFQAANPQAVKEIAKEETTKKEESTPSEQPKGNTSNQRQQGRPTNQDSSNTATKQRDSKPARKAKETDSRRSQETKPAKKDSDKEKGKSQAKKQTKQDNRSNRGQKNSSKEQNNGRQEKRGGRERGNRYREADYEFDVIIESEGVLDTMQDGYGFLRSSDYNYLSSPDDIYVSQSQIRLFGLKTGDTVLGEVRTPKDGEKYFPLIRVLKINGLEPEKIRDRIAFEHLTPLFPNERFRIAERQSTISTRIVDLLDRKSVG